MSDLTDKNFGLIIAFLLPGFLLLWGASESFPQLKAWLDAASAEKGPSVGGFLYATLASLALGLMVSAVRQIVLDRVHYGTGVQRITASFTGLTEKDRFAAFRGAIENHYRFYQYYGNTLVAVMLGFSARIYYEPHSISLILWVAAGSSSVVLFFASRKELSAFGSRATEILSNDSHADGSAR